MNIQKLKMYPQRKYIDPIDHTEQIEQGFLTIRHLEDGLPKEVKIWADADASKMPAIVQNLLPIIAAVGLECEIERFDFGLNDFVLMGKTRSDGFVLIDGEKVPNGSAFGISACYLCPDTGIVKDTDIDAAEINADLKAVAKAIYACDGGKYKEINGLMLEQDQPDTPVTKTELRPKLATEVIGSKAVVTQVEESVEVPVHDKFPMVNAAGQAVADPKDPTKQAVHLVPRMKAGKKVSATKKKRLATLLAGI